MGTSTAVAVARDKDGDRVAAAVARLARRVLGLQHEGERPPGFTRLWAGGPAQTPSIWRPSVLTKKANIALLTVNGSFLIETRTITSIGPNFSKDGVLQVISFSRYTCRAHSPRAARRRT